METLINDVVERDDIVLTPSDNREYALRTFALTYMEYEDAGRLILDEDDRNDALSDLHDRLKDGLNSFVIT
jgi:hypothetical protein